MRGFMSVILGAALLLAPQAFAADAKPAAPAKATTAAAAPAIKGVGVVDVVVLMRNSSAAKSIEKQLVEKRKVYRDQIAAQEKKLRATEETLIKERASLKPAEFETKRKAFEKSLRDLQQSAQKKHFALEQAASKAVNTLQGEITKIVAEQANAKKLQLVMTRESLIVVEKSLDITASVMAELNKRLPDVKITVTEPK